MSWFRLFLPFAGAYFLSYHFRTINAVVGPILSNELSLGAADLGLLTSTYFVAFGATQLPLGLLLDRYGARKIEAGLLLFAAAGSAIFAASTSIDGLALGRALIGLGVSACLMASFKAFSQWVAPEKLAAMTGWIMTAGTLGAFASTAPLDIALSWLTWREVFWLLAGITFLVAAWVFVSVPERPATQKPDSLTILWAGLQEVLRSAHFWRVAPIGFAQIGGFMAIQSLWSSAWLMQVNGFSRSQAADHLAAMSIAMIVAYVLIGLVSTRLAKRGISPRMLLGGALGLALTTLIAIVAEVSEHHYVLWIAYGAFSSFGTLSYSVLASDFPNTLSGRVNTTYNLLSFAGAFAFQWAMGLIIDGLRAAGHSSASAHRYAFTMLIACQLAAWLWFMGGFRKVRKKSS